MPSHPPHRPSRTTPIQTHRPSLASNRARKRSAVPTRFSGAHKCTHSGPPPASQPSPPLPSLAVNWRGQEPRHLGARARLPPIPIGDWAPAWGTQSPGPRRPRPLEARAEPPATGQVLRSPPMLPTGKGQGTLKSHPLPPRPSVSPSAAKAHVRSTQPTGEGSWTSRAGHRAPVMPVAAP